MTDNPWRLTPKGAFMRMLMDEGLEDDVVVDAWDRFEGICMREMKENDPDGAFPALVFDGEGGIVVGVGSLDDLF